MIEKICCPCRYVTEKMTGFPPELRGGGKSQRFKHNSSTNQVLKLLDSVKMRTTNRQRRIEMWKWQWKYSSTSRKDLEFRPRQSSSVSVILYQLTNQTSSRPPARKYGGDFILDLNFANPSAKNHKLMSYVGEVPRMTPQPLWLPPPQLFHRAFQFSAGPGITWWNPKNFRRIADREVGWILTTSKCGQ